MNDIICVNDTYLPEVLAFYNKHGVTIPKKDKIYTIRQVRNERGTIGFLLNEIINPEVPIKSMIGGARMIEPSFKHSRFTTLLGDKIELENLIEEKI